MNGKNEIIRQAKALFKEKRKQILMSFNEVEMHKHLKELFQAMEPDQTIEITHGPHELGKDLVIVKEDTLSIDVIGVIVKMGDIRAKTLGEVDALKTHIKSVFSKGMDKKIKEIKSQVAQAYANPAEMRTIFKELKIYRAFVVLVGELSNIARTRLKTEIKENVEIKDINWLIDNFTDYYPQVFFEGEKIDFLQERIKQLESKHYLKKRQLNLSEYFVDPLVSTIELPLKLDEDSLALIFKERKIPFTYLNTALTQKKRIILVGDPGVGKSVALTKIAIDILKKATFKMFHGASKKQKVGISILASAEELLKTNKTDEILKTHLKTQDIIERFKVDVLMIDSLDEVPSNLGEKIIKKAEKFSMELDCSLIITSRKIDAIKTPPVGFEKYELMPFEYGQAIKVFEKLVNNRQVLVSLKEGLEKMRYQIPMVPLSLILLVELAEEKKEIPASVTELYDRFFDLMLGRWDKEKGLDILFEYFRKRNFLTELAFKEFYEKERLEISKEEFKEFLDSYINQYDMSTEESKIYIKEIERAGILSINGKVQFQHRSFLDYFIARYIFDKRTEFKDLDDFIVRTYFNDIWGEVAFYYVGLMREASPEIIEKILAFEGKELFIQIEKFLIGKLLQAGWNSLSKTKYNGIERAITYGPLIRDKFLKLVEKTRPKIPRIYADFYVLFLSEQSFGSRFLSKQAKDLLEKLSSNPTQNGLYEMMFVIWACRGILNPDELKKIIQQFLYALNKIPNLPTEDKIKSYLILSVIKKEDKAFMKMIKRRLNRLKKIYQNIFKELLPQRKKGFR